MRPDESSDRSREDIAPIFMPNGHLDESAAHAFIDGALPDADAARVVRHLRACEPCGALVAEARGFAAAAAGVLRRLDDGPGALAVRGAAPPSTRSLGSAVRRPSVPRTALRTAAAMLLAAGLGGSAYLASRSGAPRVGAPAGQGEANAPASAIVAAPGASAPARLVPAPPASVPAVVPPGASAYVAGEATAAKRTRVATPPLAPAVPARATEGIVIGEVRDMAGHPLAATAVAVAGTSQSALTDSAGRFVVRVPVGTARVRARRIGYTGAATTVAVGPADTARVTLQLATSALDLDAVAMTGAESAVPVGASRLRSERRVRRTGVILRDAPSCFAVRDVRRQAANTRSERVSHYPSPVRLREDGVILTDGGASGTWTLIGADSLRLVWDGPTRGASTLGRDGAGWAGRDVGLTPAAEGCVVR